jgi:hypothetical protein
MTNSHRLPPPSSAEYLCCPLNANWYDNLLSFASTVGARLRIITLILLGIILSVSSLFAQTSTGRIAGTVTDQSGAAVKGVTVTIVDERTNQERTAATNDDGNYAFTGLQPSSYTLRA